MPHLIGQTELSEGYLVKVLAIPMLGCSEPEKWIPKEYALERSCDTTQGWEMASPHPSCLKPSAIHGKGIGLRIQVRDWEVVNFFFDRGSSTPCHWKRPRLMMVRTQDQGTVGIIEFYSMAVHTQKSQHQIDPVLRALGLAFYSMGINYTALQAQYTAFMRLTVDQKAYLAKHAAMFCFLETRYHLQQANKWFESLWECFVVYWPTGDLSQTGIDALKQQVKNNLWWLFWSLDRATQYEAATTPHPKPQFQPIQVVTHEKLAVNLQQHTTIMEVYRE
ncbi:hypothetical protein EDD18DRAFT_1107738 [Armillaria luteobubalina]|uniref:Uncharacterized protein n=1 Tax=Armillaria luteobubalina TaxID=153913 RepID=A0AA39Q2S5_9AGAR|nr:hypothetical protein EDD18DRAFT_1107738 [Armillaria luteobubalina]